MPRSTPEAIERTYAEVLRRAGQVLAAKRSVILDATFSTRRWRQAAADLARDAGARFVFIETRCADHPLRLARLASRREGVSASASDATDVDLDELTRRYEPLGPSDPGPQLPVDTGSDPAAALASALAQLSAAGLLPARERRQS